MDNAADTLLAVKAMLGDPTRWKVGPALGAADRQLVDEVLKVLAGGTDEAANHFCEAVFDAGLAYLEDWHYRALRHWMGLKPDGPRGLLTPEGYSVVVTLPERGSYWIREGVSAAVYAIARARQRGCYVE